jgi:predicted ATPase
LQGELVEYAQAMPSANDVYLFRHALTRDAAYQLMPPSARARLHAHAAAELETLVGDELDAASPDIADHLRIAIRWCDQPDDLQTLSAREITAANDAADYLTRRDRHEDAIRMWHRVIDNAAATRLHKIAAGSGLVSTRPLPVTHPR